MKYILEVLEYKKMSKAFERFIILGLLLLNMYQYYNPSTCEKVIEPGFPCNSNFDCPVCHIPASYIYESVCTNGMCALCSVAHKIIYTS